MKRYGDVVSGGVLVLASIIMFFETRNIRAFKIMKFGPKVMPRLLSIALFIVGVAIVLTGLLRLRRIHGAAEAPGGAVASIDYKRVAATMVLIAAYVLALRPLGFVLVSIVYLFCQFVVLGGAAKLRLPIYGLLSLGVSLGIYYLFYFAFNVLLPPGRIW